MGLRKHAVLTRTTGWLVLLLLTIFIGRVESAGAVSSEGAKAVSSEGTKAVSSEGATTASQSVPLTQPLEVATAHVPRPELPRQSDAVILPRQIPAVTSGEHAGPLTHTAGLEFAGSYGFFRHLRAETGSGADEAGRLDPGLTTPRYATWHSSDRTERYTTWQVNDRLALHTGSSPGSSPGARSGPGLQSVYAIAPGWDWAVGFRYERNRHRAFSRVDAPGDVAATEGLPVFSTLRFGTRNAFVALIAGAEFRGKLRIEDEIGGRISARSDRPSAFAGVAGRVSF